MITERRLALHEHRTASTSSLLFTSAAFCLVWCSCDNPGQGRDDAGPSTPCKSNTSPGGDSGVPVDASERPSTCAPAVNGELLDITGTPAGPYLIHHPRTASPGTRTIVFLPGGSGSLNSARRAWERFLSGDPRVEDLRVVIPYSATDEFIDEARRTFVILDEVLACYGGDPAKVHLAGYSNGGMAAYALMLAKPERFATLLGTPGLFPRRDPRAWAKALGCRPVFNGVGELDDWKPDVRATHEALEKAGAVSIYVEYPGEGHRISDAFDESILFDFWFRY
ncbi:MAG: hypothetical protein HY698_07825 [Deltaproteobacteria bacterium]|nr:hypothetical protein [Deltaproteobacteria bacterium]